MQQIILHGFIFIYGLIAVFTFMFFVAFTVTVTYGKERPRTSAIIQLLAWGVFITAFWPICGVIEFAIKEGQKHNRSKGMDEKRGKAKQDKGAY